MTEDELELETSDDVEKKPASKPKVEKPDAVREEKTSVKKGIDWSKYVQSVSPSDIDAELKRHGITTLEELANSRQVFVSVVTRLLGVDYNKFVSKVRKDTEK